MALHHDGTSLIQFHSRRSDLSHWGGVSMIVYIMWLQHIDITVTCHSCLPQSLHTMADMSLSLVYSITYLMMYCRLISLRFNAWWGWVFSALLKMLLTWTVEMLCPIAQRPTCSPFQITPTPITRFTLLLSTLPLHHGLLNPEYSTLYTSALLSTSTAEVSYFLLLVYILFTFDTSLYCVYR